MQQHRYVLIIPLVDLILQYLGRIIVLELVKIELLLVFMRKVLYFLLGEWVLFYLNID